MTTDESLFQRILAIETSERRGSVAAVACEQSASQTVLIRKLPETRRTAQTISAAMKSLLSEVRWRPEQLAAVAVTTGPGSFTGLRIGVTAAKVLAYVAKAPVVAVRTLDVIATQASVDCRPLWAVMDAQRDELFAAKYGAAELDLDGAVLTIGVDKWIDGLASGDWVSGPIAARLQDRLPPGVNLVAADQWAPRAEVVGAIAAKKLAQGLTTDCWRLTPEYFRKSAAEERLVSG